MCPATASGKMQDTHNVDTTYPQDSLTIRNCTLNDGEHNRGDLEVCEAEGDARGPPREQHAIILLAPLPHHATDGPLGITTLKNGVITDNGGWDQ